MKKKLYCSPDRKLCGVCSGIADYYNIDPTIVRLVAVLIGLATQVLPALIVYFVIALVIPKAPDNYYQLYQNTSRRLTRSHDKKIAGVCGGLAEWFGIDPTIVRVIFLILIILFGYSLAFYIACIIVMPKGDEPSDQQYYTAPGGDPNAWQQNQNTYYQNPNDPYSGPNCGNNN